MTAELTEWEKINAEQNRLAAERRAAAAARDTTTSEQKRIQWLAEHNVPTSTTNLNAKLAEIKRAEDIENESRNK